MKGCAHGCQRQDKLTLFFSYPAFFQLLGAVTHEMHFPSHIILWQDFSKMARKLLSTLADAVNTLWTVGDDLREIYNSSTDEAQRRKDRLATAWRVAVFAGVCGIFVTCEAVQFLKVSKRRHSAIA